MSPASPDPGYDDRKTPNPYVEMLIRWSDDSDEVEIVYLSPMDGERLRPVPPPQQVAPPPNGES